jgi:predicted dehydrogenase
MKGKMKTLKWGIAGTGNIAAAFAHDLNLLDEANCSVVGSRSLERAQSFADENNFKKAVGSYEALFGHPEVDIVYVATPHHLHAELTIEALNNGKHVICEKPIAINAKQTKAMVEASKKNNRFLMEALWTRFNPIMEQIFEHVSTGEIGDIRYLFADFAFRSDAPDKSRLFNPELGGGALLDVGIYPVFLAYSILGMPNSVTAKGIRYHTGVDYQSSLIFEYDEAHAVMHSGFASDSKCEAIISGRDGRIDIHPRWHEPRFFTQTNKENGDGKRYEKHPEGRGFTGEIMECHKCIEQGQIASPKWSHQDSINMMTLLDEIRNQIGVTYPGE